ncbi:TaqI-like C-terminal specificity domain-containing protein [Pelistega ratti]|uniref:TaqI-like C-terminal specificity domain-containing protein n=1 Tax=Pelistega ratti TaxID=2652177 RepID=UPI00242D3846|nr:TaqI-like C-terminal specificity domain-containing protein [Pelistega ratti]
MLRGRDIKKYSYEFADLWLINTHNGIQERGIFPIDVNKYPAIKKHLNQYYDKLESRQDKGVTPYNLRNCNYMEDFFKPKLIYSEIVRDSQFYFDKSENFFPEATAFIMVGDYIEKFQYILNSKFMTYIFKTFYAGGGLGDEGLRYKKIFLEKLPIPLSMKDIMLTEENVDDILFKEYHLNYQEVVFFKNLF